MKNAAVITYVGVIYNRGEKIRTSDLLVPKQAIENSLAVVFPDSYNHNW